MCIFCSDQNMATNVMKCTDHLLLLLSVFASVYWQLRLLMPSLHPSNGHGVCFILQNLSGNSFICHSLQT
jgi:hypothetical protein